MCVCTLFVYSLCTVRMQFVYSLYNYSVCSLQYTVCIITLCIQFVDSLHDYSVCTQFVYSLCTVCMQFVYSLYNYSVYAVCTQFV